MNKTELAPEWNIESEYSSVVSAEFLGDVQLIERNLQRFMDMQGDLPARIDKDLQGHPLSEVDLKLIAELLLLHQELKVLSRNVTTYVHCLLSIDTKDEQGQEWDSKFTDLGARIAECSTSLRNWIRLCRQEQIDLLLRDPRLKCFSFRWAQSRRLKEAALSSDQEELLTSIEPSGFLAWSGLYDTLSGSIKCAVKFPTGEQSMGLSQAHSLLRDVDEPTRKAAWWGIQNAWETHEEASAAILNSLAGWRLASYRKRSKTKTYDHLDYPLVQGCIRREALQAMFAACEEALPKLQGLAKGMAKTLNKKVLDPWDLLASLPEEKNSSQDTLIPYHEAIELVREGLAGVDASLGEFVSHLHKNSWIEGRLLATKSTGGYCTGFPKSRTPRIFMSYRGSFHDVMTLAHEIGHAYHAWVMRDLPLPQTSYPMTLAETASVFAETAMRDVLKMRAAGDPRQSRFSQEILWSERESAIAFLVNIPARFEFEHQFYQARREKTLTPNQLCDLNERAWKKWYGDALSQMDRRFWSHKLHFSMSRSFYNFPYTFGYLFSLSVYSHRKQWGAEFMSKYNALLRDTGAMEAEDLALKHLGADLTKIDFWRKAVAEVLNKVNGDEI